MRNATLVNRDEGARVVVQRLTSLNQALNVGDLNEGLVEGEPPSSCCLVEIGARFAVLRP